MLPYDSIETFPVEVTFLLFVWAPFDSTSADQERAEFAVFVAPNGKPNIGATQFIFGYSSEPHCMLSHKISII